MEAKEGGIEVEVRISPAARHRELADDVRHGLLAAEKWLPPNWFYDEEGSRLFEAITRLEEYYPTRVEAAILAEHASAITGECGARALVELGSGLSEKTLILLDAMVATGSLEAISSLDVSEEVLRSAARTLHERYRVPVHAVVGDFRHHLAALPRFEHRLVCFLGGTIGNLAPRERHRFLVALAETMGAEDFLLVGTDLVKSTERLVAAYDDAAGITARFNKNLLAVLNRELGADFVLERFTHVARWNAEERWIEMRLRSSEEQIVKFPELDVVIGFAEGEELRSEISAKFTADGIAAELAAADLAIAGRYTDPAGDFLLTLARPTR